MTRNEHQLPLVTLRREDPPMALSGPGTRMVDRYADELAKIKADPGQWYVLLDYGERDVSARNSAVVFRKQAPGYEFTVRKGVVYARWVGES